MQASFFRNKGILPELSRTIHLESGILDKSRLPDFNDFADFSGRFFYFVYLYEFFTKMNFEMVKPLISPLPEAVASFSSEKAKFSDYFIRFYCSRVLIVSLQLDRC